MFLISQTQCQMEEMCLPYTLQIKIEQPHHSLFVNQSFHTLTPTILGLSERLL